MTEASTADIHHGEPEAPFVAVDTLPGNGKHRFDLTLKRIDEDLGEHGYPYEVWLAGELIVKSRDPEFAACRKLASQGASVGRVSGEKEKRRTTQRWT